MAILSTVGMQFKTVGAAGARQNLNAMGASTMKLSASIAAFTVVADLAMQGLQKLVEWVGDSVKAFREFETRMAEVSTILSVDLKPQIHGLGAGVEVLSMKFGQATSDMAKGLYDILSAAFAAKDAINLLNTATKASIAGLSDVRTSVDIFTTVLNSYGMAVEQATRVSDILFTSVIRGKFQFTDLESALGFVVPIAAQAGIRIDELMAAMTTATRHGLHLDMTSRGLALAMQNIINPTEGAKKAAAKYGIEMDGLSLRVLGLYGWFEQLGAAVDKFGKNIIGELIPNMRSLRVAMVLAGDVGLAGFSADMELMANSLNATEIAMEDIMKTSQFLANQLTQQMEKVKRDVGDSWDELVLNIQRGILGIAEFFGGTKFESKIGEAFVFVEDDDIHNAQEYLRIQDLIAEKSEELAALGEKPTEARVTWEWAGFKIKEPLRETIKEWEQLDAELKDLNETGFEFQAVWNRFKSSILDAGDAIGDLDIKLMQIEIDIEKFQERLEKPIQYGWGNFAKEVSVSVDELTTLTEEQRTEMKKRNDVITGTLGYEWELLKANQEYADATHDVTLGLKMAGYGYKSLSADMQANIDIVREYEQAQKDNSETTERMNAAMRETSIAMLELQLRGMKRRRGLTRGEERQMKKLQITQAQARLENMKAQDAETENEVSNYQIAKREIDDYLLKLEEQQYQMKYTYDQQIIDLEATIKREGEQLDTRYEWWKKTNTDIITSTQDALDLFSGLSDKFIDKLEEEGIEVGNLRKAYENLNVAARGRAGAYSVSVARAEEIKSSQIYGTAGSIIERLQTMGGRTYQRGTHYVPHDMPAMLHKGETVTPRGGGGGITKIHIDPITVNANITGDTDVESLVQKIEGAIQAGLLSGVTTEYD